MAPIQLPRPVGAAFALAIGVAAAFSGSAVPQSPGSQPDDVREARKALQEQRAARKAAADRAAVLQRRLSAHQAKLAELRRKRIAVGKKVQRHETKLSHLENRLAELRRQADRRRKALLERHGDVKHLLLALQRLAHTPRAGVLAGDAGPLATVRGALMIRSMIPKLDQRAATLRAELKDLAAINERLASRRRAAERKRRELKAKRDELARLTAKVHKLLGRTRQKHERVQDRMAEAAREAKDLAGLIARYERARRRQTIELVARLEQQRRRAQRRAAPTPLRAPSEPPKPGYKGDPRDDLRVPVSGRIVSGYGEKNDYGQRTSGVTFATRSRAQVLAPLNGQVIFVGPFQGYGEVLILENGNGYTTVLAGLSEINVRVDDYVLAGEPIGRAREAGGDATVYLELRAKGKPVDPQPRGTLQASLGKKQP